MEDSHLTETRCSSRENLRAKGDSARVGVGQFRSDLICISANLLTLVEITHKTVDDQFDGLFWGDTDPKEVRRLYRRLESGRWTYIWGTVPR